MITNSIFLDNKYTFWYYSIVNNRRMNKPAKKTYSESHHIIPESFYINRTREGPIGWLEGNPNARSNRVRLTGREHALCHWLLTKMTDGVGLIKCRLAFDMMGTESLNQGRKMTRLICRAYERNKFEVAQIRSDRMKINNPMDDPVARNKVSASKIGKKRAPFSQTTINNMTLAQRGEGNGMYGKTHSEGTRALQGVQAEKYGWVTDGVDSKRVLKMDIIGWLKNGWSVGRTISATGPRDKIKCPHCSVESAANTYKRWHGDNCRHKA